MEKSCSEERTPEKRKRQGGQRLVVESERYKRKESGLQSMDEWDERNQAEGYTSVPCGENNQKLNHQN